MSFGLSGAHRSGKTTLAKLIADKLKIHYLDASTTQIMKETGFNPVAPDAKLETRLHAQDYLLRRFLEKAYKAPFPFISDRTPLDYIGYMLGEVTMHNTSLELSERIEAYTLSCMEATKQVFTGVAVLRPLNFYEVNAEKPPENKAYQRLVQFLIEGAAYRLEATETLSAATIFTEDLDDRVTYVSRFFSGCMAEHKEWRENVVHH